MLFKGISQMLCITFLVLAACKTRDFSSDVKASKAKTTPTSYVPDDLSGSELWKLTEENVFDARVHKIFIKMNQGTYDAIHKDEQDNQCKGEFDVKWAHARHFVFDDVAFTNVGVKIRGNTSRCIPRVQLSVDFDRDELFSKESLNDKWSQVNFPGTVKDIIKLQNLYGLKSFSLRRSANDSSASGEAPNGILSREYLSSWAFAQSEAVAPTAPRGAPVYRVGYALVEFQLCKNDADRDCRNRFTRAYNVSENINKQFINARYDDPKPTLVQANKGCAFKANDSFNTRCYDLESLEGKKFDPQSVPQVDKATSLLHGPSGLVTKLKAATTPAEVEKEINVDSFMNYMSASTTVGHWDSLYGNFNNDFLYYNSLTKRWSIIAWDLDNTFDYDNKGNPKRDYTYKSVAGSERYLFDTIFRIPELDKAFRARLKKYREKIYTADGNGPISDKIVEARDTFVAKMNKSLHSDEKLDPKLAKEMFDYKKERFEALTEQLKD